MTGIVVERCGPVGYLTLAQPASLNALTLEMVEALHEGLKQHEADSSVYVVVLRSASDRAFCAGGDMKRVRQFAIDGDFNNIETFFTKEYALNLAIAECTKPYVSLIDGVAMGGGLGLSVHGSFRVVTEKAIMAMPESRIGFFPDVGGSYFLQRLAHDCGIWLALTAMAVRGPQCVMTGLATHFIEHEQLSTLVGELETLPPDECENDLTSATKRVSQLLNTHCKNSFDEEFEVQLQARATWFESRDIDTIKASLAKETGNEDAQTLLSKLDSGSPHSYAITLALFKETRNMDLRRCLETELKLAKEACAHPDLVEGVRAVLVDKDHKAQWR
ncbi:MAG: enoyl-CoA hydratase/isomerase family protein [Granulosicoccus sp.]